MPFGGLAELGEQVHWWRLGAQLIARSLELAIGQRLGSFTCAMYGAETRSLPWMQAVSRLVRRTVGCVQIEVRAQFGGRRLKYNNGRDGKRMRGKPTEWSDEGGPFGNSTGEWVIIKFEWTSSKNCHRLARKMLHHSFDDATIQVEMAIVTSGMWRSKDGAMARLMRVIRRCIDRDVLMAVQAWQNQQQLAVLVDVDHVSDETTRKTMSCYLTFWEHCLIETQSARQATGMRCWSVGGSSWSI